MSETSKTPKKSSINIIREIPSNTIRGIPRYNNNKFHSFKTKTHIQKYSCLESAPEEMVIDNLNFNADDTNTNETLSLYL